MFKHDFYTGLTEFYPGGNKNVSELKLPPANESRNLLTQRLIAFSLPSAQILFHIIFILFSFKTF